MLYAISILCYYIMHDVLILIILPYYIVEYYPYYFTISCMMCQCLTFDVICYIKDYSQMYSERCCLTCTPSYCNKKEVAEYYESPKYKKRIYISM